MEQVVTLKVGEATITMPATSVVRQILADIGKQATPAQPAPVAVPTRPTLNEGELYAGLILGKDGEADYHLILLPGEAIDINWQDAKAWAEEQGGELPTRREQSLLFANAGKHFKPRWYWSCEEHKEHAHSAWGQDFHGGDQVTELKVNESCARAVRRTSVI